MNSDNYEFSKSSAPQTLSDYSSYSDKNWNYINDINSGVYNTSGQTLLQFDMTSIYNSNGFSDVSDLYLAIPTVMVATCSAGSAILPIASTTAGYSLCALKSNYQNLIHQMEVVANGKTVQDMQPFTNVIKNFKLLSELSATDLKSSAASLGLSDVLDNEKSVKFSTANLLNSGSSVSGLVAALAPAAYPGVGLCNNLPFAFSDVAQGPVVASQNLNQNNQAILNRVNRIIDTSANSAYQNIYGAGIAGSATVAPQPAIMSATNIINEFKPYYTVTATGIMTWYDVALIPLKYLCDCIDKMGLVKKMDLVMRIYLNTGAVQVQVQNPGLATVAYGTFSSNFGSTCPLTVNYLPAAVAAGGIPTTTTLITAGLYVAKLPTSFGPTTAIALAGPSSHPMTACRCYYSTVQLEPSKALAYVESNTNKQIIYENFLYNQYSAIGVGSSFSQLVQSGIKNPIGVAIIPLISASNTFQATNIGLLGVAGTFTTLPLGFSQYASPYDTCPATYSPISLTNLQVTLGGVNVLNTSLYYTYENFMEQVILAESLTSSDIGIATGVIPQSWWESNRVYWVDLARGQEADKASTRNLNISFVNNSNVIIDILVFTVYLDKFVLNVETGQVRK